jgi:hypothetical protein
MHGGGADRAVQQLPVLNSFHLKKAVFAGLWPEKLQDLFIASEVGAANRVSEQVHLRFWRKT